VIDNIVRKSSWATPQELFDDPKSAQSRALEWLLGNKYLEFYSPEKQLVRWALAVFYYSTNGDVWRDNTRWLSDYDECTWYASGGPACNSDKLFANLALVNNRVVGTLPPELGLLANSLEVVDVSSNQMLGSVPPEMGALTQLQQLRLTENLMDGTLPGSLSALSMLRVLRIDGNFITGQVPTALCESLDAMEEAIVYADCLQVSCPCCTYCCILGLCVCQENDPIQCAAGGSRL